MLSGVLCRHSHMAFRHPWDGSESQKTVRTVAASSPLNFINLLRQWAVAAAYEPISHHALNSMLKVASISWFSHETLWIYQIAAMDDFLAAVGAQAMRYAIRSGIALTSSYAINQCSRLLKAVDDKNLQSELRVLQKQLDGKIKVLRYVPLFTPKTNISAPYPPSFSYANRQCSRSSLLRLISLSSS